MRSGRISRLRLTVNRTLHVEHVPRVLGIKARILIAFPRIFNRYRLRVLGKALKVTESFAFLDLGFSAFFSQSYENAEVL